MAAVDLLRAQPGLVEQHDSRSRGTPCTFMRSERRPSSWCADEPGEGEGLRPVRTSRQNSNDSLSPTAVPSTSLMPSIETLVATTMRSHLGIWRLSTTGPTSRVVEAFDVSDDVLSCFVFRRVDCSVDALVLEGCDKLVKQIAILDGCSEAYSSIGTVSDKLRAIWAPWGFDLDFSPL